MASGAEAPTPRPGERCPDRSLVDEWRAEVGDEEIARIVNAVRDDAAAGLLPGFTEKDALLRYWSDRPHTSA